MRVAAEQVAIRAVVVHAISGRAAAFYVRFGFQPLASEPRTLMITLDELRGESDSLELHFGHAEQAPQNRRDR